MMKWFLILVLAVSVAAAQEGNAAKSAGSMIFLRDYGTDDIGYLVVPDQQPSAGVVVLPDRYGVTPAFKAFCDALALEGYIVLGVDLYNGSIAKSESEAAQMATFLIEKNFNKTVQTGVKFFESSPRFQMEKKNLICWGETCDFAVRMLGKERALFSSVSLLNPSLVSERDRLFDLRRPLQILLPASSAQVSGFRILSGELSERLRGNFEFRVMDRADKETDYIPLLKPFMQKALMEPAKETLFEKIF